jgi:hypothetical protein
VCAFITFLSVNGFRTIKVFGRGPWLANYRPIYVP